MASLLHIIASPRGEASASLDVAHTFIDALKQQDGGLTIDTLDLFANDLPAFTAPAAKAKYAVMAGEDPTDDAQAAWVKIIQYTDRLKAADKLLISAPMWNFSIPYSLKHWIDIVTQPGLTFRFDPETGYAGLVTGRAAMLILSRGGDYSTPETMGYDQQEPYLRQALGFMGFTDIQTIAVQPTLHGGPDVAAAKIAEAKKIARNLAQSF